MGKKGYFLAGPIIWWAIAIAVFVFSAILYFKLTGKGGAFWDSFVDVWRFGR
jgi:dolichyl-phosphate-mannose--protein O-mannosyl transferase